jgi:hypothetical protein
MAGRHQLPEGAQVATFEAVGAENSVSPADQPIRPERSEFWHPTGAALFYGATLLVAAWWGQLGCEATVLSNSILGRDDQIGCPVFSPIDEAEARSTHEGRQAEASRDRAVSSTENT